MDKKADIWRLKVGTDTKGVARAGRGGPCSQEEVNNRPGRVPCASKEACIL